MQTNDCHQVQTQQLLQSFVYGSSCQMTFNPCSQTYWTNRSFLQIGFFIVYAAMKQYGSLTDEHVSLVLLNVLIKIKIFATVKDLIRLLNTAYFQ